MMVTTVTEIIVFLVQLAANNALLPSSVSHHLKDFTHFHTGTQTLVKFQHVPRIALHAQKLHQGAQVVLPTILKLGIPASAHNEQI